MSGGCRGVATMGVTPTMLTPAMLMSKTIEAWPTQSVGGQRYHLNDMRFSDHMPIIAHVLCRSVLWFKLRGCYNLSFLQKASPSKTLYFSLSPLSSLKNLGAWFP